MPTDCGSHTHTLVPDPRHHRVLLYVASYTAVRPAPSSYGNECKRFDANGQPLHNKISVVEVPLRDPAKQRRQRAALPAEGVPDGLVRLP